MDMPLVRQTQLLAVRPDQLLRDLAYRSSSNCGDLRNVLDGIHAAVGRAPNSIDLEDQQDQLKRPIYSPSQIDHLLLGQ